MESMETTFADKKSGGDFTQNRIPELTKIANANENFRGNTDELNGGYALEGGTWTIGGMFSQTSGLPLLIPIDTNDMDMQEEFFPGTITLGDILKDEGYNQALMIGSDAEFGGRKKYFAGHGDYTMWDYEYAKTNGIIPKDYKVFWGYEDAKLFENAKTKVSEMAEKDEPFNFTMLTVDTHFEDGYLCDDCPTTFDDNYSNVYACSSHKINDFLSWLKTQDFYENTTVILNGDHLTMDSDFCENVDENTYNRKTFTSVINAPVTPTSEDRREFSTLDMFPTTLAALGAEIEGNRLGLGTNLFSENATLVEMYGKDGVNAELVRKSAFMEERTSTIRTLGSIYSEVDPQDPDSVEEARLSLERKTGSEIKAYDPEKNSFTVSIWSVPEDFPVFYAKCAVWTGDDPENQEDLQWFEFRRLKRDEDGKVRFSLTVNLDSFEDKSGTYNVHVYLMDTKGIMYNIGQLSTQIETAAQ